MNKSITIATVCKSGGIYDWNWVRKIKTSIYNNLTLPHNFVCMTDLDMDCDTIPLVANAPIWWSKLELFRPNLFKGPVLYLDLDIVVCGSLDQIVKQIINQNDFLMYFESNKKPTNSSFMFWKGDYSNIWKSWNENFKCDDTKAKQWLVSEHKYHPNHVGQQEFTKHHLEHFSYIQDIVGFDKFKHIKKSDRKNWFKEDLSKKSFLVFHGDLAKPNFYLDKKIIQDNWQRY